MLGPATRQRREIARRQSWFLHSAAPQVVPVVVVRTKRSRLRTRRFAQTAALPSVRTLHAPRAATSAQACRSRRASRPPDSRQPDSFGLATILKARFLEHDSQSSTFAAKLRPRIGPPPCGIRASTRMSAEVRAWIASRHTPRRTSGSSRAQSGLRSRDEMNRRPRQVARTATLARKRSSSRAALRRVFVSIP